jgi:outer membrane protein OmpA-like peptidoglycan-associated protein
LGVAAILAACASTPAVNPQLEQARAAYERAAADPAVARSAQLELQQAQQALRKGDDALRAGDDVASVDHQAYLARQRVEVAVQAGRIAQADQEVAASRAQRDRILIDARTREAETQRDRALRERTAAEAARKLAEERLAAAEAARQQATAAKTRAGTLEAQLAELKARNTERGMVLTLGDVLFDTGRATLKPGAMRTVDQLATFMTRNAERRILIEGHTDSQGSDEYNRDLSQRRAESVRNALAGQGVASSRIDVVGAGEGLPVANNTTASGRQQNRRVEIIFSDASGSIQARRP